MQAEALPMMPQCLPPEFTLKYRSLLSSFVFNFSAFDFSTDDLNVMRSM